MDSLVELLFSQWGLLGGVIVVIGAGVLIVNSKLNGHEDDCKERNREIHARISEVKNIALRTDERSIEQGKSLGRIEDILMGRAK